MAVVSGWKTVKAGELYFNSRCHWPKQKGQAMKKILVVEDHDSTVHNLKQSLERSDYEVYIARSGREALNMIDQHRMDLVLLDLGLPDMSGLQVCKEFRKAYPLLPIIIISVKSDERDKVRALNLCADDYVSKPYYM